MQYAVSIIIIVSQDSKTTTKLSLIMLEELFIKSNY